MPRSLFLRLVVGDRWWLRNPPQKMRRRCRRGAARRGRSRASVPAARSRAVNFELVRDATAYVCPECGTKCATDRMRERGKTERGRERERDGGRGPCRTGPGEIFSLLLLGARRAAASFSAAERFIDSTRRFCRRETRVKASSRDALSMIIARRSSERKKSLIFRRRAPRRCAG